MQKPVEKLEMRLINLFHHLMAIHLSNLLKNMPKDY